MVGTRWINEDDSNINRFESTSFNHERRRIDHHQFDFERAAFSLFFSVLGFVESVGNPLLSSIPIWTY